MISNLLAINYKNNFNRKIIMSSELHKYIETSIEKKENLLAAKVINFTNKKKENNLKKTSYDFWRINDKSNIDQLKAVTGICFMIGVLIVAGLYSSLV
tara:strand:+ start:220 stop:513 length:294 start_codon:yes stop_codon:yes gene_type:complete